MNILIVDGYNLFIKVFSKSTAVDENGSDIGGVIGFIRSIRAILKNCPALDEVIIVFDGVQSGFKRRIIQKDYKKGRQVKQKQKLTDFKKQFDKLLVFLDFLPIKIINVPMVEADDIIGFLVKHYKDDKKIIFSTDKDYFQLIDDTTIVHQNKNKSFNKKNVKSIYDIKNPLNWRIIRAITGDKSDNIKGIRGVGIKTALKMFPILKEEKEISLEEFLDLSEDHTKINRTQIKSNFELINLIDSCVSNHSMLTINTIIRNIRTNKLSLAGIRMFLVQYKMFKFIKNFRGFILPFLRLDTKRKQREEA